MENKKRRKTIDNLTAMNGGQKNSSAKRLQRLDKIMKNVKSQKPNQFKKLASRSRKKNRDIYFEDSQQNTTYNASKNSYLNNRRKTEGLVNFSKLNKTEMPKSNFKFSKNLKIGTKIEEAEPSEGIKDNRNWITPRQRLIKKLNFDKISRRDSESSKNSKNTIGKKFNPSMRKLSPILNIQARMASFKTIQSFTDRPARSSRVKNKDEEKSSSRLIDNELNLISEFLQHEEKEIGESGIEKSGSTSKFGQVDIGQSGLRSKQFNFEKKKPSLVNFKR